MDTFVRVEGQLVISAPPIAAGRHQLPLKLCGLYHRSAIEILHCLLVHLAIYIVRSKPCNDIQIAGVIPIRLMLIFKNL